MIARLLALTTAAALAAATLTGCVAAGPMSTSTVSVGDVTGLVLETSGDVEISEGEPSLTIHAPERVLEVLTVDEKDGVLVLGRRPGLMPFASGGIRYELTVPSLTSIEIDGSGDVTSTVAGDTMTIDIDGSGDVSVTGLDADTVAVTVSGSGDVGLSGDAGTLTVRIDGSGDVDADDLDAVDATIAIAGSGDAEVHVTGTLGIDISGSGSVRHRGGAEVEVDISGSGDVDAVD